MFPTVDLTTLWNVEPWALGRELGWLLACLMLAYGISAWLGRQHTNDSVWFGRRVFDGVLFPLLAMTFAYAAHRWFSTKGTVVGVLALSLPVLVSLAAIRLFARVLITAFPHSQWAGVVERFLSWVAWLTAIAWTTGFAPQALAELESITLTLGKTRISLRTLIDGLISCGLVLVLVLWMSKVIERSLLRNTIQDLSLRKVLSNTVRAGMLLLGGLITLSILGVDLTALSVLGGALGVGLGFGLQKLAANYVSGFVILLERSLRIGDSIKVDSFDGVVVDIKTRYTLVRGTNGRESVVPNEMLLTQRVENLSLNDPKALLQTHIKVPYQSDPNAVKGWMEAAASGCDRVLQDPAPAAYLAALGENGLEFTLHYWIADPKKGQLNVCSDVNLAVLDALRSHGVEISGVQRLVRMLS
jgi:small-conductance mechanosensitive channel